MAPGTAVIPNAGHWLMEEQPAATITAIRSFLDTKKLTASRRRRPDDA
jgi:pimeloyl-ACP methyl ester carboxylesterase